ncbi:cytochrome c [Rhodobacteraceae bacterium M382]|nr:cytochrome c [Rhodobacteraceae bacterium M382]
MKRYALMVIAVSTLALGGWVLFSLSSRSPITSADNADPAAGEALYQANCASCHGVNLQGQPNWRSQGDDGLLPAPPHDKTGHTWHHGDGLLFSYTKLGGKEALAQQGVDFDSGMPGFGDQLSDQQIWDILTYIKSTWPDRERELQATRSEAERLQKDANP